MRLQTVPKLILAFLFQKRTIICVYVLLAVIAAVKQYTHGTYNNYLIFKYVFWHTWWQKPLYELDTAYFDSNHYGPFFSIVIAPFAILPDWLGTILWNVANVAILLFGMFKLPLATKHIKIIAWICAHECLTSLLSFQFNVGITGLILLSFSYMEKQKSFQAAFAVCVGFLVKLYGVVAFAFFFFNRKKAGFVIANITVLILLFCLPMLISGPNFQLRAYHDWFNSLMLKTADNEINLMADISFLGFVRRISGVHINVLYGCAFAGLLLFLALMRFKMHTSQAYKLLILAYVLLCLVLFNTNVESPTYIIGFLGVAIWFIVVERSAYTWFLLIFAIILTSFSPSDLFPKFIRQQYVIPYALKALPCILVWFDIAYRVLIVNFREKDLLSVTDGNRTKEEMSNWETFWKQNPTEFNATMAQSTLYFAEQLNSRFPISKKDHFLDIGCGPGFFINYLKEKCELIHGTDISRKYIEIAEKNFGNSKHITFSVSKPYDYAHYHDLIISKNINTVLILSVLQYYTDVQSVRDLLLSFKETAKTQPFRCFLADIIPVKHTALNDIWSIIKHAVKKKYTFKFIKFLFYAVFSDYRKIKKNGLLQIDESFFIDMQKDLNIKIIKDLTIHAGRYSVVIDF